MERRAGFMMVPEGGYLGKNNERRETISIRRGGTLATEEASQERSETDAGDRGSE